MLIVNECLLKAYQISLVSYRRCVIDVRKRYPIRKKIWQRTPPSKLYNIKEKAKYTPEEAKLRDDYAQYYKVFMRSITKQLTDDFYSASIQRGGFTEAQYQQELEEQEKLIIENDKENEEQKKLRQKRLAEYIVHLEEDNLKNLKEIAEEMIQDINIREAMVQKEIKRSAHYITKDKLEDAILKALDNPSSYDYAVDLKGNVIYDGDYLHPYAFKPWHVPETSDNEKEKIEKDEIQLEESVILCNL